MSIVLGAFGMATEPAALSRVICDIYDAAIDPAHWTKALQSACSFVDAVNSSLFWQDAAAEQVVTLHQCNEDPHFTRLYQEHYAPLNPVFPAAFFQDVGQVTAATDLVPRSELEDTRFFKEWIAPQGLGDSIGIVLEKEAQRAAFLAFQGVSGFVTDETRRRATLLIPHFQRAVAIGRLFDTQKAVEAVLTKMLDGVDDGALLVDADGRIVFANARAKAMLEQGALLRASNGLLRAAAVAPDRALRESLAALAGSGEPIAASGITITLSDAPGNRWIANLLPLGDGARRKFGNAYDAVAAMFVRSARFADPAPLETLAKDYQLTASEIRVIEAMLRISGQDAIAAALGISRATVKTHLNRVYRKCGAKNQSDLIKLIAGIGRASG